MENAIPTLLATKSLLFGTPQIGLGHDRVAYLKIKAVIEGNVAEIGDIGDAFKKGDGTNDPMDAIIGSQVEKAQEQIIRSFLKKDLLDKYNGDYFCTGLGPAVMLSNLDNIVGTLSTREAEQQAENDFVGMTRRVDMNESFSDFLGRLQEQAKKFISDGTYRNGRVEAQFQKSIREMDQNFLLCAGATCTKIGVEKVKWEAALLDKKSLHKRSEQSVRSVQEGDPVTKSVMALTRTVDAFISRSEQKTDELAVQIGQMGMDHSRAWQAQAHENERMGRRLADMEQRLMSFASSPMVPQQPTVHQLQMPKAMAQGQSKWPDTRGAFSGNMGVDKGATGAARTKGGRRQKEPCFECGLMWHATADCPGPCKAFCYLCGQQGHTSSSRRYHGGSGPSAKN